MDTFVVPHELPVIQLDCRSAFEGLTPQEKRYTHYFGRASWEGAKICLFQCSPESPDIFCLLLTVFSSGVEDTKERAQVAGVSEEEFDAFLNYAAMFLGNMGNYKSFGDEKFVPSVSADTVDRIVSSCQEAERAAPLWRNTRGPMFSLESFEERLGLGSKGISTYYSSNVEEEDVRVVQNFLEAKDMGPENTRVTKHNREKDDCDYCIHVASSRTGLLEIYDFEGLRIYVQYGDFAPILEKVVENLMLAGEQAANEHQKAMLECYVSHFQSGDVQLHKESQLHWIKDVAPAVESNIGFVESYRDPVGVRAEFEGFVSVVNKAVSAKFGMLVDRAEELIAKLPWGPAFEKDVFQKPDFTSLDVVAFGSSSIPLGINLPNYDSVRQQHGFKNVSLDNVLSSSFSTGGPIPFLSEEDQELYRTFGKKAFEVQVGLHELLGHGSGKLFEQEADGTLNFNSAEVLNPFTEKPITTFYRPGETWYSKFPVICKSYEECRAECVGIFLCTDPLVMDIYGFSGEEAEKVIYTNWLMMVRAGIAALEFYDPASKKWGQAHMQARFGILRCLLDAGEEFVSLSTDGENVIVSMDGSKIESVGKPAVGEFLRQLHIFKSIGDFDSGKALYDEYTSVSSDFVELRNVVMANRKPRKIYVQPHTRINSDTGEVELVEFPASTAGVVESMLTRFPDVADVTLTAEVSSFRY